MRIAPLMTAMASLAAAGTALAMPQIGQPAPGFTATDSNGKQHQLADFAGKTVVLEWTNADCPYVKKHYGSGNMQALQQAAANDGAVWLTINSGAPGKQGHLDGAGANALMKKGRTIKLEQRVRAEEEIAVAAASLVARAEFLRRLASLSGECGLTLPKGAGPQVDEAARSIVKRLGPDTLERVAKLHFKTTKKVLGTLPAKKE